MNNNRKPMAAALGSALALSAGSALAADNPFAMVEFGEGVQVAARAVGLRHLQERDLLDGPPAGQRELQKVIA
mgnify:CR=1 FL=1